MAVCCGNVDCTDCQPFLFCEECNFYGVPESFDDVDATMEGGHKYKKCPACGSADISTFVRHEEGDDLSQ